MMMTKMAALPMTILVQRFIVGIVLFLVLVTWLEPSHANIPLCSEVFPGAITEDATTTLNLPPFPEPNDGDAEWEDNLTLAQGTYYFENLVIANSVVVTLSGPVLIFVESGMDIGNNVSINAPGNPAYFVVISYDQIDIGNNTVINGLLYSQGDVQLGNNVVISGALTAEGEVDTRPNTSVDYDLEAVENADFDGLCSNGAAELDHIRLLHPPTGLTCSPADITVQACANPDCSDLFATEVNVSLTSPAGNWSSNPILFTGSTSVALQYTVAGTITLNAAANDSAASGPTRCFSGGMETDCSMIISEAGFILELPDHIAAESVTGTIAAVRADDTSQSCAPAFINQTRVIDLYSLYGNPGSGSANVLINGAAIANAAPDTGTSLTFNDQGVAAFNLGYADVGQVEIHAAFHGSGQEAGLVMTGVGDFIARPSHFELSIADNPAATEASGPVFRRAGEPFDITVGAFNAAGQITPNFGRETPPESVSLTSQLVAPLGGNEGLLSGSFGEFGQSCSGPEAAGMACGQLSWNEVGIIELIPALTSSSYLGTANVTGLTSGAVGRFIPNHFTLSGGQLTNRAGLLDCNDSFSYFGERFDVGFSLLAQSVDGSLTENYTGAFARLGAGQLNLTGSAGGLQIDASTISWTNGVGPAQAQLRLARSTPDGPHDNYLVSTAPTDSDGVGLLASGQIGSTRLVFGRLLIDNAIGSELGPLALPWRTEYWDGNTWRVESNDNCTNIDLGTELELDAGDGTQPGDQPVVIGGGNTAINTTSSVLTLESGLGQFYLDSPGASGWVELILGLGDRWSFLRDDLDDSGAFDNDPQARATFGLFDGSSQRIYLREVSPR